MQPADRRQLTFIKLLLKANGTTMTSATLCHVRHGGRTASLPTDTCKELITTGLLQQSGTNLRCTDIARLWLRRQLSASDDAFADQHRDGDQKQSTPAVNRRESPLTQLKARGGTHSFLQPHQIEAGERFSRLFDRAGLRVRTTMTYSAERTAGPGGGSRAANDLSDMVLDARRQIDCISTHLPADCLGVIFDVCGFEKGLQLIEAERQWPRRSAKLVLRIGLEQLAEHFGLAPVATGKQVGIVGGWMTAGSRPTQLG